MPFASSSESSRIAAVTLGWVLMFPLSLYAFVLPGAV